MHVKYSLYICVKNALHNFREVQQSICVMCAQVEEPLQLLMSIL